MTRPDCESSVDGKCKLLGGNCTDTCGIPAGRAAKKKVKG